MLTCVIVDDEPYATKLLEEYAAKLPGLQVVKKFYNPLDALEFLSTNRVDVVFLDISMPKLSGMELAKIINPSQKIVFTTAFAEHAVESYRLNAIDYLLKPLQFQEFLRTIEKVKAGNQSNTNTEILFVKSGKAMVRLSYEEIRFIEGMKDYVIFQTTTGKHIVYKRMKDLEAKLPLEFKRIHLSFIINMKYLKRVENNQVHFSDVRIPIGEKYRDSFMEFLKGQAL